MVGEKEEQLNNTQIPVACFTPKGLVKGVDKAMKRITNSHASHTSCRPAGYNI